MGDFDKCDDGFEDGHEQYMQINQQVHFDSSSQNNAQEIIFINNAQLYTYSINNRSPLQEPPSHMLCHPKNHGIEKQIKCDGANNDNRPRNSIDIVNDNVVTSDEIDDDEVLIYDTQL